MSHYDLYASLGVDRTASSAEIATDIEARITNAGTRTDARTDELSLALAVLGDPARRELYDRQLDNPSAPEITTEAVRQLAMLAEPADRNKAAQTSALPQSSEEREPTGKAEGPRWIMPVSITAVVAVVSAIAVVVMVTSSNTPSSSIAESPPEFSANETNAAQPSDTATVPEDTPERTMSEPATETSSATVETPEQSDSPDTLVTESGDYGVGLQARERCETSSTAADYVLTGRGTAQCNFASAVGDQLANTSVSEDSERQITAYSPNQKQAIALTCRGAQDSDKDKLWKCTVDSSGSVIYVYP